MLDDDYDPRVEGSETFEVFLSSAVGSTLAKPYHSTVVIYDETLDGSFSMYLSHNVVALCSRALRHMRRFIRPVCLSDKT